MIVEARAAVKKLNNNKASEIYGHQLIFSQVDEELKKINVASERLDSSWIIFFFRLNPVEVVGIPITWLEEGRPSIARAYSSICNDTMMELGNSFRARNVSYQTLYTLVTLLQSCCPEILRLVFIEYIKYNCTCVQASSVISSDEAKFKVFEGKVLKKMYG